MQDQPSDQKSIPTDDTTNASTQETTGVAKKKISTLSLIGILSTLTLMVGGAVFIYIEVMSKVPTRAWREIITDLPWETEHFTVEEVETEWKSSEGDDRMMRRVACYPVISIKMDDIKKNGKLMVSFHNENMQRQGDIISLPFTSNGFTTSDDFNISYDGNKVSFYPLAGYKNKDDYLYHQVDYNAPLWSLEVRYLMDGDAEPQLLGKKSIRANTLTKKQD